MRLKLQFFNSYAKGVAFNKNTPSYCCDDCGTQWPLDMWKLVEKHNSAECDEWQSADFYSSYLNEKY